MNTPNINQIEIWLKNKKVIISNLHEKTENDLKEILEYICKKEKEKKKEVNIITSHNGLLLTIIHYLLANQCVIEGEGFIEIINEGYGFIRFSKWNYLNSNSDIFVSNKIIKEYNIRSGDCIKCIIKSIEKSDKVSKLYTDKILLINKCKAGQFKLRNTFDNLTPTFPEKKIVLESKSLDKEDNIAMRLIDIVSPIGFGQRALIVAPPKTGKTTLLKNIASSIENNYPEVFLIVLLVDERPEEVTDMKKNIKSLVISSNFDQSSSSHIQVTEMVLEISKRMVEIKKDVVIVMDSLTRLARAYNTESPSSGKVLSGGIDSYALHKPKKFFGAARKLEEGGSLTIIASALIKTGSTMDEVIFEEFKGRGNSDIVLCRDLSNKGIYPSVDVPKSKTRQDELLMNREDRIIIKQIRRVLCDDKDKDGIKRLIKGLGSCDSNKEFLSSIGKY